MKIYVCLREIWGEGMCYIKRDIGGGKLKINFDYM